MVCAICLNKFELHDHILVLPCAHEYHQECLQLWIAEQDNHVHCPLCRTILKQTTYNNHKSTKDPIFPVHVKSYSKFDHVDTLYIRWHVQ